MGCENFRATVTDSQARQASVRLDTGDGHDEFLLIAEEPISPIVASVLERAVERAMNWTRWLLYRVEVRDGHRLTTLFSRYHRDRPTQVTEGWGRMRVPEALALLNQGDWDGIGYAQADDDMHAQALRPFAATLAPESDDPSEAPPGNQVRFIPFKLVR